jgi:hypothetical protein
MPYAKSRHTSDRFPLKSLCLNVLTFPSMMLRMEGFCGLPAQFTKRNVWNPWITSGGNLL